ncbi:hypothetical protein HKD37_07G018745 [Glycine soja]
MVVDGNLRQADLPYYGKLEDIIEINYYGRFSVILFKCKWADTTRDRGYKKDCWNFNCVNFDRLIHIGDHDVVNEGWSVVVHIKPRDLYDMGEEVEENAYENEPYQEQQLEQFSRLDDQYVQLATNHLNDDIVKRFRNPQKSAPQPQCPSPSDSTQAPEIPTGNVPLSHESTSEVPAMNPEISSPPSDSTQAPEVPTGNVPLSHVSTSEVPQEDETTRRHVGRESTHCWTVEAIDSEETIKKIKVKVKGVNSLPRELRIIVNFDDQGQAIGEAQALLAGFLGTLAADCKLFPMDYDRWSGPSGVPKAYFDDCFETILKPQFYFKINEAGAKRYCKLSMGRKWAANRQSLWNEFNNPTKTRDEIIKNVPIGIDKDQWARFVHYRHKPSTLELCRRNKEIRSKQVIPHTGGSKANPRRRNELLLETGKLPSRGQLYIETHKRKDGSFVNEASKTIAEQIEVGLTQSIVDESEVSPLDVVGRVLGLEHSGRVRCMGLGAVPSNTFRNTRLRASSLSSSSSGVGFPSSNQWQEKYNNLESAFKAYMIMKEGRIPEELASYFTPDQTHLNDASSVSNTPLDARGSSGASNP